MRRREFIAGLCGTAALPLVPHAQERERMRRLIGQVENLWADACNHYRAGKFALCTFLSILAIEAKSGLAISAET